MSELLLHFWLETWEENTTKKRKQNSTCAKWWLMCLSVWVCWWWGLGVDVYLGSCSGACGLNKKGQALFPSTAPRHVFKHFISNYFPNLLKTTKYLEPPFRWLILKPPSCCRKHSSDSWMQRQEAWTLSSILLGSEFQFLELHPTSKMSLPLVITILPRYCPNDSFKTTV